MMTQVNEFNDLNEKATNPSFCYGCGQELRSFSLLVCSECLNNECDEFVNLVSGISPKIGSGTKQKVK